MRAVLLSLLSLSLVGQGLPMSRAEELQKLHPTWPATNPGVRRAAFEARKALMDASPLTGIPFKAVGPMGQGGRVMAVAMDERKPTTWLAAYATGGVWITENDGQTFRSLFEREEAFGIGDLAAVWGEPGVPKTIWVGSGEASHTRTVYMGAGIFRSDDQGRSWKHMGLRDSHHIGRIMVHPTNPDIVFAAASGPVYTDGGERGIFRTEDGGRSWKQVIACPEKTGGIEVLIDRSNPSIVYACTWERWRRAWNFHENGKGSGLWKSTDGGRTFARLKGGFNHGEYLGRMGLAQSFQNPRKLYAMVDNQTPRPFSSNHPEPLPARAMLAMSQADFLKVDDTRMDAFLRGYQYPGEFRAEKVKKDLQEGKLKFEDLKTFLKGREDIPKQNPKCVGPELWVTEDGGETWTKTHDKDLWGEFDWGYGTATYYFQRIAVDPADDRRVFISSISLLKTEDGGKTFLEADEHGDDVHADHHAIWFNSLDPKRVLLGNDGGLNLSLDGGTTWRPIKNLPVGQCYTVTYDFSTPYRVFTGLQDNGISMGVPTALKPYQQRDGWKSIWGGDGAFIQVNPKDNTTVYLESQFGAMGRLNLATSQSKGISPKPKFPEEPPFRTNWVTPIVMSGFHPDIVYTGTQFVHRSFDKGDTWEKVSPNLTSEGQKGSFVNVGGDVSYGTVSALAESPKRFGLLYAGTDEGWLWVTRDGGLNWTRCTQGLPGNKWVSRVEPSRHSEGTAYATFTGFRENDTHAYLFKTTDFGATWTSLKGNLPDECLNVVREDPVNPDLLYVGSDFGVYASLDGGKHWDVLAGEIPHVPAYDLAIHPRENDLIIGTYGRSVWVGSLKVLQAYKPEVRAKALHLFPVEKQKAAAWWEKEKPVQVGKPREVKPLDLTYHVAAPGKVTVRLENAKGEVFRTWALDARKGLNRFAWDYMVDGAKRDKLPEGRRPFVQPGDYSLVLEQNGKTEKTALVVEAPPKDEPRRREEGEN